MIESIADCQKFITENKDGNWIVHVIPADPNLHSCNTFPIALFIKNLLSKKIYCLSLKHPDSIPDFEITTFLSEILPKYENIKWALHKKSFEQLLKLSNVYDANYCHFVKYNEVIDEMDFETSAHKFISRNGRGSKDINLAIPLLKHKEFFVNMCDEIENILDSNIPDPIKKINNSTLNTLKNIESNGIFVDPKIFSQFFDVIPNKHNLVFSQYNICTSTGRPSNAFGGVNYAALKVDDGCRSSFISRYGSDGCMVLMDYATFHPRIICELANYNIPLNIDIYEYLAKLYFKKQDIDDSDIKNAKKITFRQLFGGVEEKYIHIKYFSNLNKFIELQWNNFNRDGFVLTPIFKRKITKEVVLDPNPPKLFNYILQATEGEIAIPQIGKVQEYLKDKLTKDVLYTYDSVLYDFNKSDGYETLKEIREIMSCGGLFPIKMYVGNSYQNMQIVSR